MKNRSKEKNSNCNKLGVRVFSSVLGSGNGIREEGMKLRNVKEEQKDLGSWLAIGGAEGAPKPVKMQYKEEEGR